MTLSTCVLQGQLSLRNVGLPICVIAAEDEGQSIVEVNFVVIVARDGTLLPSLPKLTPCSPVGNGLPFTKCCGNVLPLIVHIK